MHRPAALQARHQSSVQCTPVFFNGGKVVHPVRKSGMAGGGGTTVGRRSGARRTVQQVAAQ